MNIRLIFKVLGYVLLVEAGCLLLPLLISLYLGESSWHSFALVALLCALSGLCLSRLRVGAAVMQGRDGYAAVALAWIGLSLMGALPYVISGAIPRYIDALFETVSGFTTTGATILEDIERLPGGILFWRSETQWMGGMGVLVMFLALMPKLGSGAVHLMRAESPGPIKSKLVPKLGHSAKILYGIYIALTAAELLALRIAGMSWYDAVNHAFTTMATGGFSVKNDSIAAYAHLPAVAWIITVFTALAGVNFSLMFLLLRGRVRQVLRSSELWLYMAILAVATALVGVNLWLEHGATPGGALSDAVFQVVTVMTTTGYATRNFALWPTFSRLILAALMLIGGCAGSTAGGVKVSRVVIWMKSLRRDLVRIIHPKHVSVITVDDQAVDENVISSCHGFLVAYVLVMIVGALVVGWDNTGFESSFSASLTCISNVGPALGSLGEAGNFSTLSVLSKGVLSLEMLMGRLELMPILVLLAPSTWRNK
ncbi:MAG: TrkH family potassium uptake protein [Oscillospiraceae bacterium]|nr:TrkH family potassium uptake protein [Oscillospiraceae bacterium]